MIKSLTSLRGIFILFIFFHHAGVYPGGGTMAVAFFFVLSGFSMTLGYKGRILNPDFNYKQYLLRRCIKFYPLHWITLLADIPLVLMSTLQWWLIPVFFINATLLQTLVPIQEVYFSFNAVSWFLSDILIFSVLFPFVFRFIFKKTKKQRITIAIILLIIYGLCVMLLPGRYWHSILYISPFIRLMDFIFGIYLAALYLWLKDRNKEKNYDRFGFLLTLIIGILIVLLIAESYFLGDILQLIAPFYWPLVAVLIICASMPNNGAMKLIENKYLLRLGEMSFTVFLVHRLVLRYTSKLIPINSKIIYVVVCLFVTIILCLIIERFILTPITQWLTKKIQPSTTVRS